MPEQLLNQALRLQQATADANARKTGVPQKTPFSPIAPPAVGAAIKNPALNAGGQPLSSVQQKVSQSQKDQLSGKVSPAQAQQAKEQTLLQGAPDATGAAVTEVTKNAAYQRDSAKEQAMMKKMGISGAPTPAQEKLLLKATYNDAELRALGLYDTVYPPAPSAAQGTTATANLPAAGSGISNVNDFMSAIGLGGQSGTPGVTGPASAAQLAAMGITPEVLNNLVQTGAITPELAKQLQTVGGQMDTAAQVLKDTPQPTNATLGVLETALKQYSGVGKEPLGESDLFKKAGLSGYAVLAQSLDQHSNEMKADYNSYADVVSSVGSNMQGIWQKSLDGYKASQDSFNTLAGLTQKAKEKADDWSHTLQQMKIQNDLDINYQKELTKMQNKTVKQIPLMNGNVAFYDPVSNTIKSIVDGNTGEVIGGEGFKNTTATDNPEPGQMTTSGNVVPDGQYAIGDAVVTKEVYDKVFGIGVKGLPPIECGTYGSTLSTAPKVGDSWKDKEKAIDQGANDILNQNYTPKAGDKLLVPLGVASGKNPYGHEFVVTSYNPTTGDMYGVQANMDLKGTRTTGKYNIYDLQKKYGTDWGIASGELKSSLAQQLTPIVGVAGSIGDKLDQFIPAEIKNSMKSYSPALSALFQGLGVSPAGKSILGQLGSVLGEIPGLSNETLDTSTLPKAPMSVDDYLTSSTIDATMPNYTKAGSAPNAGGLSLAALDQEALQYAMTGQLPANARATKGPSYARGLAIANRAAIIAPNGIPAVNKAQLSSITSNLTKQSEYLSSTQRSFENFDKGFQQLTSAFEGKVNDFSQPIANIIANSSAYNLGEGDISAFKAGLQEVRAEYQQVISRGGVVSDTVRNAASEILDPNVSFGTLKKVQQELSQQGQIVVSGAQKTVQDLQSQMMNIVNPNSSQSSSQENTSIMARGPDGNTYTLTQQQAAQAQQEGGWTIINQ